MLAKRSTALFLVLVATLFLGACGSDSEPTTGASPTPEAEPSDIAPAEEFVILPETGKVPIAESCIDEAGDYTGFLPDDGLLVLRGLDADRYAADLLPSGNADPLSSDPMEDLVVTAEGDYVTGEPTVYTEGGESLTFEFAVLWGADTPACEGDLSGGDPSLLYNTAFVDDEEFALDNICGGHSAGFTDYFAAMSSIEDPNNFITIHLEIAETNEGDGEYVEITETGSGGAVQDLVVDGTVYSGSAFISNEGDGEGNLLVFAFDTADAPVCD